MMFKGNDSVEVVLESVKDRRRAHAEAVLSTVPGDQLANAIVFIRYMDNEQLKERIAIGLTKLSPQIGANYASGIVCRAIFTLRGLDRQKAAPIADTAIRLAQNAFSFEWLVTWARMIAVEEYGDIRIPTPEFVAACIRVYGHLAIDPQFQLD